MGVSAMDQQQQTCCTLSREGNTKLKMLGVFICHGRMLSEPCAHTASLMCCCRRWFHGAYEQSYLPKSPLRLLSAAAHLAGHNKDTWRTAHFLGRQTIAPPDAWVDVVMPGDNVVNTMSDQQASVKAVNAGSHDVP